MTGYTPLLTADDLTEENPEIDPRNPKTGEQEVPVGEASELAGPRDNINNLYGFHVTPEDEESSADPIVSRGGITTEGIMASLGADANAIGSPDKVKEAVSRVSVGGDTQLAREVNFQTRNIRGKLDGLHGANEVDPQQIENQVVAEVIEGVATGKTDGEPLVTESIRQGAERAAVGAALVENADSIQSAKLKNWAKNVEHEVGSVDRASNEQLDELGRQAENAGITLETVQETVQSTTPETAETTEGPEAVTAEALTDTERIVKAHEAFQAGNADATVELLTNGNEAARPYAAKLIAELSARVGVAEALGEQGQRDYAPYLEAIRAHVANVTTTPEDENPADKYTLAA